MKIPDTRFPSLKPVSCATVFFSSAFQAFGIYNIHAASQITEGGVLGATLLLDHWLNISPALTSLILTGLCYFLGWQALGKEFLGYSAIAAIGYALGYWICQQFPPLWPEIASHPLSAALTGALFIGIGAGLCVRAGGATCGDDALAMSLSRVTGIPIQWVYLVTDLTVLGFSLSYIPLDKIVYSLLTVTLSGQIIGWIQRIDTKKRLD